MEPTYHFISHSHWDREWYKAFETFRLDLVDMINILIDIFKTNPQFQHFTLDGQTIILRDYTDIMPHRQKELRELIQNGRISIGPWYVLPDEFLVSGESTVRNLLFGRNKATDYGNVMEVGYIPDSFGHLAMMPAILRGFDMDTAIVYRGFGGESGQDKSEYCWRSPDGSTVLMTHLPPNGYSDAYFGENNKAAFIDKGKELKTILDPMAVTLHRLCMNGGDHHFPESYLPQALGVLNETLDGKFIHSSIPEYIQAVKQYIEQNNISLAEVDGELRGGFRYAFAVQSGVYSTRMYLKQANYTCEQLLTRYAEPLLMWASVTGRNNLIPMINQAWDYLLQNHPHDSICGCSIDPVHREMMIRFEKCQQIGEAVIEKSLRHVYPDKQEGQENILIFNPIARKINSPVKADIEFFRQNIIVGMNPDVKVDAPKPLISGFRILDSNNNEVPFQIIRHNPEAHGFRFSDYSYPSKRLVERYHLLLDAKNISGLGFDRYRVQETENMPKYHSNLKVDETFLENDFIRIEPLPNGSLTIIDKRNGHRFEPMHIFEDGGDAGDEYNYSYPQEDQVITSQNAEAKINLIESGPLRAALEIKLHLELPESLEPSRKRRSNNMIRLPITTKVYLYYNQPRVEFEASLENTAKDHRLRVLFPTRLKTNTSYADSQFTITKREHQPVNPKEYKIEVPSSVHPMQRGVTILDDTQGLTVATAGLPEYELNPNEPGTLAITLIRGVARLSGGDLLTRPGGEAGWITDTPDAQCLGKHIFRYALIPHSATEFENYNFINEQLEAFHLPCQAMRRQGEPEKDFTKFGLELSPSSLVLSALKAAENNKGTIARFYNPTAKKIAGQLHCAWPLESSCWTQLNERDGESISIENGHLLKFTVNPFTFVSVRLQFTKSF